MIRSSARTLVDCTASRKKFWAVMQAIRGRDRHGRLKDLRLGQADLDPGLGLGPLAPAAGIHGSSIRASTSSGDSLVTLLEIAGDLPAAKRGGRHDAHGDLLLIDHQADRRPEPEPIPRLHGQGHSRWSGQGVKRRRATEPGRPHDGQDHNDFGIGGPEVTSGAVAPRHRDDQASGCQRRSSPGRSPGTSGWSSWSCRTRARSRRRYTLHSSSSTVASQGQRPRRCARVVLLDVADDGRRR